MTRIISLVLCVPLNVYGRPSELKEKILVFGDYDTDGITSTALITWVLKRNGAFVETYLPHRLDDGYGLTEDTIKKSLNGHKVIVTVDCGINSVSAVKIAKNKGVDVIVTDHHQPGNEVPDAYVVINPKLNKEMEKLNILAGVGVCFKLCHGFIKYGREHGVGGNSVDLKEGLDLVTLGTVADIVPLVGENRCLVKNGMKVLKAQRRPGVRALIDTAGVRDPIEVRDISFKIAPRLNAAGRMGHAKDALDLLQTENIVDAYPMAGVLDKHNRKRKLFEDRIFETAKKQIDEMDLQKRCAIVISGREWHPGVIGIVASKLAQKYYRPTIVLSISEQGEILGSGRSIEGLNLVRLLNSCGQYLLRFGGHPMATGLSLHEKDLKSFEKAFELETKQACRDRENLIPLLKVDGDIGIEDLDERFFTELETIHPFGHSNPAPVFRFLNVSSDRLSRAGKGNTRGILFDENGNKMPFIAFGISMNEFPKHPWNVAATPALNVYNGDCHPQIQILDVVHA